MILRRLTTFYKLVFFWAVIGLSESFKVSFQNIDLMKTLQTLKQNDDLKACDSILQIGHLLGRNGVEWRFNFYYSKMLL